MTRRTDNKPTQTRDAFARALLENSVNAIVLTDQHGSITYVNPALLTLWGGDDRRELIGRPAAEFWSDGEVAAATWDSLRRDGRWTGETTLQRKNGEATFVYAAANIVTDRRGRPKWIMATFIDISDKRAAREAVARTRDELEQRVAERTAALRLEIEQRRRAERALRERDALNRAVIDNSPLGISVRSRTGRLLRLNAAWRAIWAMSDAEIEAEMTREELAPTWSWRDLLSSEQQARVKDVYEHGGALFVPAIRAAQARPGAAEWASLYFYAIVGTDGAVESVVVVTADISERKLAEQAYADSQRQLAGLLEFLPDATLVINVRGEVLAWNRAMEALTGVPAAAMIGKGDYEYALPFYGVRRPILVDLALGGRNDFEAHYADFRREGDVLFGESYIPLLRDGSVYLQGTAAVLRDADGRPAGAVECLRDITAHKQAEQRAETAARAKSDFLTTMSHELRTPLHAILGFASLLSGAHAGRLNEQQAQYAENILVSGRRLLQLVNDVLDLSKAEAGKMEVTRSRVRVDELLADGLLVIRDRAAARQIALTLTIPPDWADRTIWADERKIKQVLYNLFSNALKFTPDGGAIEARAGAREGEVVFAVADNGAGVNPEDRQRIFDSFEQADAGFARRTQGTGLGLALSRRFVEMHKGRIWVESPGEGFGSTFYVALPDAPPDGASEHGNK